MASGRSTQLTRQIGEHLVVAELGRRGFIATPFAGNVPHFDILAVDKGGVALPIQVKAIRGGSWQFTLTRFIEIDLVEDTQHFRSKVDLPYPELISVFVLLSSDPESRDRYFLWTMEDLQDYLFTTYGPEYKRPRKPDSYHCAIRPEEIGRFEDNWGLVESSFDQLRTAGLRWPRYA